MRLLQSWCRFLNQDMIIWGSDLLFVWPEVLELEPLSQVPRPTWSGGEPDQNVGFVIAFRHFGISPDSMCEHIYMHLLRAFLFHHIYLVYVKSSKRCRLFLLEQILFHQCKTLT